MATDTNTSKKIDALKCKLIECVVKLAEFKVPSHITVLDKNEVTHFGTPNVMQKFEDDIEMRMMTSKVIIIQRHGRKLLPLPVKILYLIRKQ